MASDFTLSTFLSKMATGGALQSLFTVELAPPSNLGGSPGSSGAESDFQFFAKATTFPESAITATEISYMGRPISIPGNREVQQWNMTMYNDEDFKIRNLLESWMEGLNAHQANTRAKTMIPFIGYTGTMGVHQWAKEGGDKPSKSYSFHGVWPSSLGEITLDWETNEIQEYEITWEYSYWSSKNNAIGQ